MPNSVPSKASLCYMIAPFGKDGSEARKKADFFFKTVVKNATKDHFLKTERELENIKPGEIQHHIYKNLIQAELVIADVTGGNANVLFELGMRLLIGKPTILMASGSPENLPFDIRNQKLINIPDDTYSWSDLSDVLDNAIRAAMDMEDAQSMAYKAYREFYAPVSPNADVWNWKAKFKFGIADKWMETVAIKHLSDDERSLIADFDPYASSTFPQTQRLRNYLAEYNELRKFEGQHNDGIMLYTFPREDCSLAGSVMLEMEAANSQYFNVDIDGNQEKDHSLTLTFYQKRREVVIVEEPKLLGTVREYEYPLVFKPSKQGRYIMNGTMYYPDTGKKLTLADVTLIRR